MSHGLVLGSASDVVACLTDSCVYPLCLPRALWCVRSRQCAEDYGSSVFMGLDGYRRP